jgi:hypothetical protein
MQTCSCCGEALLQQLLAQQQKLLVSFCCRSNCRSHRRPLLPQVTGFDSTCGYITAADTVRRCQRDSAEPKPRCSAQLPGKILVNSLMGGVRSIGRDDASDGGSRLSKRLVRNIDPDQHRGPDGRRRDMLLPPRR